MPRNNRDLLKALRPPSASFYLYDFHVHSVGSADICIGKRFDALPETLKTQLTKLDADPPDLAVYDTEIAARVPVEMFFGELLARRNEVAAGLGQKETENWAFVAITDHNVAAYSCALSDHSLKDFKNSRLLVLPGIELELHFPVKDAQNRTCQIHVLCIFAPGTKASDIRIAINDARTPGTPAWEFGSPLNVDNLADCIQKLRAHGSYPSFCVAAHVGSSKGVEKEPKHLILDSLNAEIARLEGAIQQATANERKTLERQRDKLDQRRTDPDKLHIDVLRLIGQCGFDGLQVRGQSDERHYRRLHRFLPEHGRSTPVICSDAHTPSNVFDCNGGIPHLKMSRLPSELSPADVFREIRDQVLRFGETRTTYAQPGRVMYWLEGIEIVPDAPDARKFWNFAEAGAASGAPPASNDFLLPLSCNLNCLIGGRGSGKSAAIEAVAFLSQANEFTAAGQTSDKDWPDWYRRAAATLRGCQIRLCWKTTGANGIGQLPKKALFTSRYFDTKNRHTATEFRDANDQLVVGENASVPEVSIFRVHDIERTAEPDNLRVLFDELCGNDIVAVNGEIQSLSARLSTQRDEIVQVAKDIASLTAENTALRQYAIRKKQFTDVDRAEIRKQYERIDQAEAVVKCATDAKSGWDGIGAEDTITSLTADITNYFSSTSSSLHDDDGNPKPGCEPLAKLFPKQTDPPSPLRDAITNSLSNVQLALTAFSTETTTALANATGILDGARNELGAQGFPSGGKDRESKKRAFEEAEKALEQYKTLVATFDRLLSERITLHAEFAAACAKRTTCRKQLAERLTTRLAQDLDTSVLRIEVDAQPIADRKGLSTWLLDNLEAVFRSYKQPRSKAIVDTGLMPAVIRNILLGTDSTNAAKLRIDKPKAEDGRITESEAAELVSKLQARVLVNLDGRDECTQEEFETLVPEVIRDGIWSFPLKQVKTPSLAIDSVLQLDEVVLDDLPEIRLNDRPSEAGTTARPLSELSPGQRCSAILPILLLTGDGPLIIDQPEDNLDNRLIRQVIVNILASMKLARQVIVATHNPNLPVLGDAEQCVILQATGRDDSIVMATGDLRSPLVAKYITDIMEGGREAFQYRQSIYQAHWDSTVDELPD